MAAATAVYENTKTATLLNKSHYFWGTIGPVPVVVEVVGRLELGVYVLAEATGDVTTGLEANADIEVGAQYDRGDWSRIEVQNFSFEPKDIVGCLRGHVKARAWVKPIIEVKLYTVVGPVFDVEPYIEFDGRWESCTDGMGTDPQWALTAGVAAHAKIELDILDKYKAGWEVELFDISRTLATSEGGGEIPTPRTRLRPWRAGMT